MICVAQSQIVLSAWALQTLLDYLHQLFTAEVFSQVFLNIVIVLYYHLVSELAHVRQTEHNASHINGVIWTKVGESVVKSESMHLELILDGSFDELQHRFRQFQHSTPISLSALGEQHYGTILNILTLSQSFNRLQKFTSSHFLREHYAHGSLY